MKKIQAKLGKLPAVQTKAAYPKSQSSRGNGVSVAKSQSKATENKGQLMPDQSKQQLQNEGILENQAKAKKAKHSRSLVQEKAIEYREIEIQKAIYGGQFLSTDENGSTYIIDGIAEIGERLRVEITESKNHLVRAKIREAFDKEALKKRGLCPQLYECGGCAWQKLDEKTQLLSLERDIFHQIKAMLKQVNPSRVEQEFNAIDILPTLSFAQEAWRCTARVHWEQGEKETKIGFYEGNQIIDIAHCMQFHPLVDQIYQFLKQELAQELAGNGTIRISASPTHASGTVYFEEEGNLKSHIDQKYLKHDKTPVKASLFSPNLIEKIKALITHPQSKIHGVSWKNKEGKLQNWGKCDNLFTGIPHAATSFVQAHQQGNQALITRVVEACSKHKGVIEIYAGSGNFTIPIAQAYTELPQNITAAQVAQALKSAQHLQQNKGNRLDKGSQLIQPSKKRSAVTAFEWDSEAVDQLRVMAYERQLDLNVTNIKDEGINEKLFAQDGYDCLLMDPPRAGANEIIQKLKLLKQQSVQTRLKKIVYVSCHAPALCRDLKDLLMLGEWKIKRLQLFNLFPHTGHIEVFCEIIRA